MKRILSALILCFYLIACSEQDKIAIENSASVFDIEQGKAAIEQSNLRFSKAFKNGDSAILANSYTEDAQILVNTVPTIEGRDSIRSYYRKLLQKGLTSYKLTTSNIWGDSTLLVEEGEFSLMGPKKDEVDHGVYIVLWRTEGGNWKMYRHMAKSDYASYARLPESPKDSVTISGEDSK